MSLTKSYNHSYWEQKVIFCRYDLIIIGAGIVGLSSAISFKKKFKKANVLVLEKGFFTDGASIKNAGFACFGSAGELVSDLEKLEEKQVWDTVNMRWQGLKLLRSRLGDKNIQYQSCGGFELFDSFEKFSALQEKLSHLNEALEDHLKIKNCYVLDQKIGLQFNGVVGVIKNKFEGQLDTGFTMESLRQMAFLAGIKIMNGVEVESVLDTGTHVEVMCKNGVFKASKVVVCTNGFSGRLMRVKDVLPARAQVLITKPIKGLKIKGTFHFDEGFYYFRNIDQRILLGGGRNLAIEEETTDQEGLNLNIQNRLELMLKTMILPNQKVEIEHRWSGIMGVGSSKKPIIQWHSKRVLLAIRMGGMGVAIGSYVGEEVAKQLN